MSKYYLTVSLFFIFVIDGNAQQWKMKRIEGIFGVGTTNVYGDLGGAPDATSVLFIRDITFRSTRPSLYAGLRYRLDTRSTLKTSLIYGYSKTADFSGSRNELREFSSMTQLIEFSANYEYYLLSEQRRLNSAAMFNRRGMINNFSSFAAYVFIGLGATFYRPDLELPEPREGDLYRSHAGITASLPLGAGVKYIISDLWIIGYEIGYRQTLCDFLDGFKSPWSKRPDIYWFSSFNFSYRISTTRNGLPVFLDRRFRNARF